MPKRKSLRILISTGPTREYLDPVRFISNPSTGRIGFELAKKAVRHRHKVILISGPSNLPPPKGVKSISIETTDELKRAVLGSLERVDAIIMASAVTDFKPAHFSKAKIKKQDAFTLLLKPTTDILAKIAPVKDKVKVGFALETENLLKNAIKKLKDKELDFIVANELTKDKMPFGSAANGYYIIDKDLNFKKFRNITKTKLASIILDKVEGICYRKIQN